MRPWLTRVLLASAALAVLVEVVVVARSVYALAPLIAIAWIACPGIALARAGLGTGESARRAAWLVGPAIGFGFSVFGLLLWWAAGVQGWSALALAPLLTWGLARIARRFGGAALRLPALDRRDLAAAAAVALVVPVITLLPYDHVREPTVDGDAYRAYFTADFVWAMAAVSELAKGDVPPANPFLTDQPMRYYWLSHLLSGALYRNAAVLGVSLEEIVLLTGLAFGLAFVLLLYWLARACGAGPVAAAIAIAVAFAANSYEGLDRLWTYQAAGQPLDLVRTINVDAVTRWFYQGMPVDGLQRLLLYQPHHLTGYALALAAMWLIALAEDVTAISVALWAGVLLGLAFLFSTFTAIIGGAAIALLYVGRLWQQRRLASAWQCALLGGAPVALAVGISAALGYTDPRAGLLLTFLINPVALTEWPYVLLLNFGPLLVAGIAGLVRWRWTRGAGAAPAALVGAAFVFYFTADVPDMGGVWVGWRSGHLLLIAFAMIGGSLITSIGQRPGLRAPLAIALVLLVAPAVPTVAIDVYNAQDITNRGPGPQFPWTQIIPPREREALDWIRRNTPPAARVQVEPHARNAEGWAYIPAFGERRMAAGLPIAMIPLKPYHDASFNVRDGVYMAVDADDAHAMAEALAIDYVVFGRPERQRYAATESLIAERPDIFPVAFSNDAVTVYRIAPTDAAR